MVKRYKVAEIAEIYNVSRASVNRAIEKANLKIDFKSKFVHYGGDSKTAPKLIDESGLEYLEAELGSKEEPIRTSDESSESNQTLKVLIQQLEEKDKQIAEKDIQIKALQESEKDLRDLLKAQAGQLLQINSGVQALSDSNNGEVDQAGSPVNIRSDQDDQGNMNKSNKGIWRRIFG